MALILPSTAGATIYNALRLSLASVGSTSTNANLEDYIAKFSASARQDRSSLCDSAQSVSAS